MRPQTQKAVVFRQAQVSLYFPKIAQEVKKEYHGHKYQTFRENITRTSYANIRFTELCQLLRNLEFKERVRGSHHIFTKESVEEILNLQPKGGMAKPYQVKQVRNVILKHKMGGETND